MVEARVRLHEAGNGEGGGAAATRVDGDKDVTDVLVGLAHVVVDGRRRPRNHGLNVLDRKRFLRTVGRDAEGLAQEHCWVFGKQRAYSLNLFRREPSGHRRELVPAFFWVVSFKAVITNERDLNRLKYLGAEGVGHLHHF